MLCHLSPADDDEDELGSDFLSSQFADLTQQQLKDKVEEKVRNSAQSCGIAVSQCEHPEVWHARWSGISSTACGQPKQRRQRPVVELKVPFRTDVVGVRLVFVWSAARCVSSARSWGSCWRRARRHSLLYMGCSTSYPSCDSILSSTVRASSLSCCPVFRLSCVWRLSLFAFLRSSACIIFRLIAAGLK